MTRKVRVCGRRVYTKEALKSRERMLAKKALKPKESKMKLDKIAFQMMEMTKKFPIKTQKVILPRGLTLSLVWNKGTYELWAWRGTTVPSKKELEIVARSFGQPGLEWRPRVEMGETTTYVARWCE